MTDKIIFEPIGVIHSPFDSAKGMPIQPVGGETFEGHIEIFERFADGLKDLDGFSHIFLIYHFIIPTDILCIPNRSWKIPLVEFLQHGLLDGQIRSACRW